MLSEQAQPACEAAVTEEEILVAQHELRKWGYSFFYRFSQGGNLFTLRARRTRPMTPEGWREEPIELRTPADVGRLLAACR